jgi:hypothetical protein
MWGVAGDGADLAGGCGQEAGQFVQALATSTDAGQQTSVAIRRRTGGPDWASYQVGGDLPGLKQCVIECSRR